MWPWRKRSLADALKAIEALTAAIRLLEAEVEDLKMRHTSLRGRVYNAGLHRAPLRDSQDARDQTLPLTRDDLRKQLHEKWKPGTPYPHTKD